VTVTKAQNFILVSELTNKEGKEENECIKYHFCLNSSLFKMLQ